MNFKKIVKLFEKQNVCVVGLRGTGKDVLFGNVVNRRCLPYISNTYYGKGLIPFRYSDIDTKTDYRGFIENRLSHFDFPYADGTDLYLADAGVYFPSQYNGQLNRDFPELATWQALSRHLGECNFHFNVQNLNRVWDKIREQSDTYIRCKWCKVFFGKIVIQKIVIYDKYQSCVDRVEPFGVRRPFILASPQTRQQWRLAFDSFKNQHGTVREYLLVYINKSKHNTRSFRDLFLEAKGGDS